MSTISNDVLTALQGFQESYGDAQASTGSVERPPDGEWDHVLISMKIDMPPDFEIKTKDGQRFSAFKVDFRYETLPPHPPGLTANPLQWPGKTFVLPKVGFKGLPDKDQTRYKIETERLKGVLKAALGKPFTGNIMADIQALDKQLNTDNGNAIALRVKCQRDSYTVDTPEGPSQRQAFKEFGVRNLGS